LSPEQRLPRDHPLRAIRAMVDEVLRAMSRDFDGLYATIGRPSVPPERLLRAQLLQIFYSIRSERLLMEQLDYNILFAGSWGWRWTSRCGRPPLHEES
jgi:transposase